MPTKTCAAKTRTKPNISENQEKPTSATKHSKSKRRVEMFVNEYLVDLNGRKAAVRAGYSAQSARQTASELLATLPVQEAVAKAMEARSARTRITVDKVLERWWAIATADPNDLIEHRRVCCRYCYGKGHRYQWTPRELAEALAQFERDKMFAEAKGVTFSATFDAAGGVGYDQRQDPTSSCPECHGQGIEVTYPKDTRDLSPEGKLLYAGVKKTHDGLEIKMHSQDAALVNVAKHLGMLGQSMKLTNDPDNPLPPAYVVMIPAKALPDDPST
jgi:phage terminase small subunit